MHACTWAALWERSPRALMLLRRASRMCTWAMKLQIRGTENSCKITAAVHIYCFDITASLMQHPQGLDCILPSRGLKNLKLHFEAETVAWNSTISVSRANTWTRSCQMLQQNKNLLGTDTLQAVNKRITPTVVVERHSIWKNWPHSLSFIPWKGQNSDNDSPKIHFLKIP